MFLSMTGYATISRSIKVKSTQGNDVELQLSCEVKTINNRFLEVSSKLPPLLMPLENSMTVICKQQLIRGRIFLNFNLSGDEFIGDKISVSLAAAKQYFDAAQLLAKNLGIDSNVKVFELLKMPGVINVERSNLDQTLQTEILELLSATIAEVNKSRTAEGSNLLKDLNQRLQNCQTAIGNIKDLVSTIIQNLQQEVARLEMLNKEQPENPQTIEKLEETRHALDKSDIHEEVVRFSSHLEKCKLLFAAHTQEKGKQLDFICQELLREINTVAAKSSHFHIIEQTVAVKVELEKIKEQVQNIV